MWSDICDDLLFDRFYVGNGCIVFQMWCDFGGDLFYDIYRYIEYYQIGVFDGFGSRVKNLIIEVDFLCSFLCFS